MRSLCNNLDYLEIKIAPTKSLWMKQSQQKCGQISIQHTKVFIESFFVTWDQKNFCQLLSRKGKKCLKSRTDVCWTTKQIFQQQMSSGPFKVAIDVSSKILKSRKNFASWVWCQKTTCCQQISTCTKSANENPNKL